MATASYFEGVSEDCGRDIDCGGDGTCNLRTHKCKCKDGYTDKGCLKKPGRFTSEYLSSYYVSLFHMCGCRKNITKVFGRHDGSNITK